MKETPVQQRVRLRLSELNRIAWRNNVGAATDATGRVIRYGLSNDTAALNAEFKSGDLIGINPVFVTPAMVGGVIGQFASFECKRSDWHLTPGDERGQAQQRWIDLVRSYGGIAGFVTGPDDVDKLLRGR